MPTSYAVLSLACSIASTPARRRGRIQIGNDYDHVVPAAAGVRDSTNAQRWRFTLIVPATITNGSSYLLRITLEDGNVIEVGRCDFALAEIY